MKYKTEKKKDFGGLARWYLPEEEKKYKISEIELTVMVFAFRYAVTRRTYAPGLVCDYIKGKIPQMTEEQKAKVYNEVKDTLKNDWCVDELAKETVKKLGLAFLDDWGD